MPPQLPASSTAFVMHVSQHAVQRRQFRSAQAQELHRVSDDKRSEPTDGQGIRRLKFSNNVAASKKEPLGGCPAVNAQKSSTSQERSGISRGCDGGEHRRRGRISSSRRRRRGSRCRGCRKVLVPASAFRRLLSHPVAFVVPSWSSVLIHLQKRARVWPRGNFCTRHARRECWGRAANQDPADTACLFR